MSPGNSDHDRGSRARALRHVSFVVVARVLVSLACLWSGFRAVSDDDYSRVAIAARFAHHPSLDPSGTSWLPLPFWLYGVPMAVLGDSLLTARAVAVLLGALAAVGIWIAARWLGLSERAALGGALGAVLLPYGAWLSTATLPEAPTAALVLLGAVSLARPEPKRRALGALALAAACLCRYEAWPPAILFGVVTAADALRERRRELWWSAACPALPIALWLLHGVVRHDDAWFFVARVRGYSAAVGAERQSLWSAFLETSLSLVRFEPELALVTSFALALSLRRGQWPFGSGAWRPVAVLGGLLGLLIAGAATGGAATHHQERSLLPVFWFMALVSAGLLSRFAERPAREEHATETPSSVVGALVPWLVLPLALAASLWLRPDVRRTFVDRGDEEHVGGLLRRLDAREVALDTDDFGFFAIQAALGYGRSWSIRAHDPRSPEPALPDSSAGLARLLLPTRARWLVTPRKRSELSRPLGRLAITTANFSVLELDPALVAAAAKR